MPGRPRTHVPLPGTDKTLCGRRKTAVLLINTRIDPTTFQPGKPEDAIDDASCTVCGMSDDQATREAYRQTAEYERVQKEEQL